MFLRQVLKLLTDDADLICGGSLFQIREPASRNARSPLYVDSLVRRTIKLSDDAERRLRRRSKSDE